MNDANSTTQVTSVGSLKTALLLTAIVNMIYGFGFMVIPEVVIGMAQEPTTASPQWVRWAGGMEIGVALAAYMAATHNMKGQGSLVTGMALAHTLMGLALAYSWAFEYQGVAWAIMTPTALTLIMGAWLWWLLKQYAGILATD
ncbi:MAG: hypothetical protein KAI27_01895 [Rhodospirillaceae bacterium]|nr:hypothetical protein [Rhodospirillaceae bacterium]